MSRCYIIDRATKQIDFDYTPTVSKHHYLQTILTTYCLLLSMSGQDSLT